MIKKLCLLILLCLMFIPVVNAALSYTDTFVINSYPFSNAFTIGASTGYASGYINLTSLRAENTTGLTTIQQIIAWDGTSSWKRGKYTVPITVKPTATSSDIVGTGTMTLEYLADRGSYIADYQTTIDFSLWNTTAAVLGTNYYVAYDKSLISNLEPERYMADIAIPYNMAGVYISNNAAGYKPLGYGSVANIYNVNFKNVITISKDTNTSKISYLINKNLGGVYSGYSKVLMVTGNEVPVNNISSGANIDATTYSAPISIAITELTTGLNMQYTYFDNLYNLSVSNTQTGINLPVAATLRSSSGVFPTAQAVSYSWSDITTNEGAIFKENFAATNRTLDYIFKTPNWYGWDSYFSDYVNNKGTTMPTIVNFYFPNAGEFNTSAVFYRPNFGYTLVNGNNVNVSGGINTGSTSFLAVDGNTGGIISNAIISIKVLQTNTWYNLSGNPVIVTNAGTGFANAYVSASGYYSVVNTGLQLGESHTIALYKITSTSDPVNLTTLNVLVVAGSTGDTPVKDAYVSITLSNNTVKSDYTNSAGAVSFIVNNGSVITATAEKAGYPKSSGVYNITGSNYLIVLRLLSTSIPTPLPLTTSITPIPIQTLIGGGNRNMTAAVCGAENKNIVQMFKNNIACWGVEERIAQDLVLAGIIIAFFAFVLSKWGKGLGAIIGASVGFILSLAAGLIPVWAFFALVIIAGLIFGLKLYGGGK